MGDLDADGTPELLVPTTDRRRLDGLRWTDTGVDRVWSLSLGGTLATNVTGIALAEGLAIGAGTKNGVRVWQVQSG